MRPTREFRVDVHQLMLAALLIFGQKDGDIGLAVPKTRPHNFRFI
jgi:hypothetical protein